MKVNVLTQRLAT